MSDYNFLTTVPHLYHHLTEEYSKETNNFVIKHKVEGKYEEVFNASFLASGVYYYSLTSEDYYKSGKLLLIK